MPSCAAFLLAWFLLASSLARAEGTGSSASDPPPRGAAGAERDQRSQPTGPRAEAAKNRDRDEEVIAHLEELERLELLQHLELFDSAAPTRRGR